MKNKEKFFKINKDLWIKLDDVVGVIDDIDDDPVSTYSVYMVGGNEFELDKELYLSFRDSLSDSVMLRYGYDFVVVNKIIGVEHDSLDGGYTIHTVSGDEFDVSEGYGEDILRAWMKGL